MKYFFLIICNFLFQLVIAQTVAISLDKQNIVYVGVDNPLTIAVEGISNKNIRVSTNNGKLTTSDNCNFIYRTIDSTGNKAIFYITFQNKNKKWDTVIKEFRIKKMPPPVISLKKWNSNKITKEKLLQQLQISCYYENFDFDSGCQILSFNVQTNGQSVYNAGGFFSQEMQTFIRRLKSNTEIRFTTIKCKVFTSFYTMDDVVLTIQ